MALTPSRIIIVMGVASSGKTVTGTAISRRLNVPFLDGDGFHTAANKDKMRVGIALDDSDRAPWLSAVGRALHEAAEGHGLAVGACSALRRSYRNLLLDAAGEPILFVFLDGTPDLLASRIAARVHEFMPASLLASQFATLERPAVGENSLTMSARLPVDAIADHVVEAIRGIKRSSHAR